MLTDHRLLVVESEMASAFKVAGRDGNTLSPVIRAAWDTGTLRTMTRNNPLSATGAHISIIGHFTAEELRRHLDSTETANGYANRFLWIAVRRSKLLPEGGNPDQAKLQALSDRLRDALKFARRTGLLQRDDSARVLWHDQYAKLAEGEAGLVGSLLARGEAQVLRLSMIYALLDKSAVVRKEHLWAAVCLWEYASRSTRYLFADSTGNPDADLIAKAVAANGMLTRTQVSALFGRHRSASQIDGALNELVAAERVSVDREATDGRPVDQIRWVNSLNSLSSTWPDKPVDEVYHGRLGDIVRTLEPHSEADPIALLIQLLVGFGNAVGRTPYVAVEADKHYTNLFTVLVGETAKARKGTSWGHARRLLVEADPGWEPRIMGGLSSGEGLIAQVADSELSELSERSGKR